MSCLCLLGLVGFGNYQLNTVLPFYLPAILLAGPLLIVPMGWLVIEKKAPQSEIKDTDLSFLILGGLCLALAFLLPIGWKAGLLAAIYLLLTTVFSLKLWVKDTWSFMFKVAFSCLPVAAAWAVADRMGWRPMGFDPLIVILTAIHFHYAGFALAILTGLLPIVKRQFWVNTTYLLGLAGVATGITATQFDGPPAIEMIATTIMGSFGIYIALRQIRQAFRQVIVSEKIFLLLGGIALFLGMLLALAYGWRWTHQWPWLTIPFMYATHGVLNSVGFAVLSLLGYLIKSTTPNTEKPASSNHRG